jgi:hypothetical protein
MTSKEETQPKEPEESSEKDYDLVGSDLDGESRSEPYLDEEETLYYLESQKEAQRSKERDAESEQPS